MARIIHIIAAARPNFMKVAPLYHTLSREDWAEPVIVHTGQHYDVNMSDAFFRDLALPEPHINLGIGSGTHAEQTGQVMIAYEKVIMKAKPDLVIVVGDVNSTVACALAAAKINYPGDGAHRPVIAHLEAGLRSYDRTMPEEINRIVTDALADILWTPSPDADENLRKEGIPDNQIVRVGNIMIDSLEMMRGRIESQRVLERLGLTRGEYGVVTMHRPSNVDNQDTLIKLCEGLRYISLNTPLVFPMHPRTRKNMEIAGLLDGLTADARISVTEPMGYVEFMNLVFNCKFVLTDSGGIQEETTYLGIPCLTARPNTERPITVTDGTNRLCSIDDMEDMAACIMNEGVKRRRPPEMWDGKTAQRVVESIKSVLADDKIRGKLDAMKAGVI